MEFNEIKSKIEPLLKRNDVEFAGIFGSYARGEATSDSDIDVLIRFKTPKGLFYIIGLEQELSELIHKDVDLVTQKALCPYIAPRVYKDLKLVYGKR